MRITWRGLELPTKVERDVKIASDRYGKFYIEPFERGFGTTVGNSLRRVLLSSLEGSAVTSIKISGVNHEFTSLNGVMEDVTDIVLNIKNLTVRLAGPGPKVMKVTANKAGVIKAADIDSDPAVEIIDKDRVIATLTKDVNFEMEMVVETGRGYVPAAERLATADRYEQEIGRIEIDAAYSPVTRVRYTTEDTRVGQKTNYDRLTMEIWTNGTITPEMALVEAAKILRKHINPFVEYSEIGAETVTAEPAAAEAQPKVDKELETKLNMPIQELELSVRASNCLESAKIETVRQLAKMAESDLLEIRSFGKTSLREVKRKLADIGLSLGMTGIE
jgi:DNA-directed RNA polymerase subunit alpha